MRAAVVAAYVHIMNFRHAPEIGFALMLGRNTAHPDRQRQPGKTKLARAPQCLFARPVRNLSDQERIMFKPPPNCLQLRPCTDLPCDTLDKFHGLRHELLLRTHRKTALPFRG